MQSKLVRNKLSRVIIEARSFLPNYAVCRVPTITQERNNLLAFSVPFKSVSGYNISGIGCYAEFYRYASRFQRSNFIPYTLYTELDKCVDLQKGDMDMSKLVRRFSDLEHKTDGTGDFIVVDFDESSKLSKIINVTTFDSSQATGTYKRAFHKKQDKWKLMTQHELNDAITSGEVHIDYANKYSRKLLTNDLIPREDQWKRDLRGIQSKV